MPKTKGPPLVNDTNTVFKIILRTDGSRRYYAKLANGKSSNIDAQPEEIKRMFLSWLWGTSLEESKKEGEESAFQKAFKKHYSQDPTETKQKEKETKR